MTTPPAPPAATGRLRTLLPTLLDLLIPTAGYFVLHRAGLPDVWALTIAGSATGVNALVNTVRRGRLDALGLLVVAEIAVSVALVAVTDDPRLILARPAVYLAVAGVVNLVSCVAGRPLSYTAATPMATKGDPQRALAYERAWHHSPQLRAIHRQLTAAIGLAMIVYAILRVAIVYSFATGTAVLAQEVPGLLLLALVVLLIRRRVPRLRGIVDAEQAALAAEHATSGAEAQAAGAEHDRQASPNPTARTWSLSPNPEEAGRSALAGARRRGASTLSIHRSWSSWIGTGSR